MVATVELNRVRSDYQNILHTHVELVSDRVAHLVVHYDR